jgi:hypothetical protein
MLVLHALLSDLSLMEQASHILDSVSDIIRQAKDLLGVLIQEQATANVTARSCLRELSSSALDARRGIPSSGSSLLRPKVVMRLGRITRS